ncbi:Mannitol-specific phosphotransferase enzyme IIA component [compost metagenome]
MTIFSKDKVNLDAKAVDKYEAIRLVGQMLVDAGHVPTEYIDKMIERENDLSTYMGGGLAIPHGTNDSKRLIRSTGLAVAIFSEGVDFGEEKAYLLVGIAAVGSGHLELLTNIAVLCSEEENIKRIINASSKEELISILEGGVVA